MARPTAPPPANRNATRISSGSLRYRGRAIREQVDFVLIAGDLFHTGQILPRTFARTIETLQPMKDAGIPCIAVEGNHDWIHRRDSISWMEALSHMGYIKLLRPDRTEDGGYRFEPFDEADRKRRDGSRSAA